MLVAEIFHSIQGEGILAGVPSVFLRTSGCNLRCHWCDTPYASWNPEGETLEVSGVLERLLAFPCRHVVLTGGEPMIAARIQDLADGLRRAGRHITIETAATVPPNGIACDLASLSPKLANSRPDERAGKAWRQRHERTRWQPAVIRAWVDQGEYQLKFVVTSARDMEEIDRLLNAIGGRVDPSRILLMPEGTRPTQLHNRGLWLARLCVERGFRFCPRLHIELFGHSRGT